MIILFLLIALIPVIFKLKVAQGKNVFISYFINFQYFFFPSSKSILSRTELEIFILDTSCHEVFKNHNGDVLTVLVIEIFGFF